MAFAVFIVAVILVSLLGAPEGVTSPRPEGSLVDTDGYMRFLRVESLVADGEWFNPVSNRSNYPDGETQHWTRAVDLYILVLTGLATPFSETPLVWAAVLAGPILILLVGLALYWASERLSPGARSLAVLLLLGSLPVVSYGRPGRLDHHGAILLCFVVVLGLAVLRREEFHWKRAGALALVMTLGLWVSTEFLVPVGLVGITLALAAIAPHRQAATLAIRAFGLTTIGLVAVLAIERGPDALAIEYDRVSVVYAACTAVATVVFVLLQVVLGASWRRNGLVLGALATAAGLVMVVLFPEIVHGPFALVDPQLKTAWLDRVAELQPVWRVSGRSAWILLGPSVLGVTAWIWLLKRDGRQRWVIACGGWLLVYLVLTSLQVRWAMFGHVLVAPLVASAVSPWLQRLGSRGGSALLRPLAVVGLVFGILLTSAAIPQASAEATVECSLAEIAEALRAIPATTVLADQDYGPDLLYRTDHRVIGTPYHRNTGILFSRAVMATPVTESEAIQGELASRDVGLILICPEADHVLRPPEPAGTLYEALAEGATPNFLQQVELSADTDLRLFAVED